MNTIYNQKRSIRLKFLLIILFEFYFRSCTSSTTFDADVEVCHRRGGACSKTPQTPDGHVLQSTATARPQDESKSFQHGFLKSLSENEN